MLRRVSIHPAQIMTRLRLFLKWNTQRESVACFLHNAANDAVDIAL